MRALVEIDNRAIGSFSELCQMFDSMVEVLGILQGMFEGKRSSEVKEE